MSLIVEDGTGLSTADSYISAAAATARHLALGNTDWAILTDAEKEQALRRATVYMEQAYRTRWVGCRAHQTQALSWPRYISELVDDIYIAGDVLPADIANACADLALKAAAGELNADLTRGVVRKKVGPLETEYDRNSPQSVRYRAIDMALAPYLKGSSAMATLVRA
jgi:hypothetical protein